MSIKTVASYICAFFSVLVIILSLATNYWIEYTRKDDNAKTVFKYRAGLWERCEEFKKAGQDDYEDNGCESYQGPLNMDDWEARRNTLVAMYILALICTLLAFIFVTVYCVTDKYYFPVKRSAIFFLVSCLFVVIGLSVYTSTYMRVRVYFSWSYGAGWSAAAMYLISTILLCADK